MRPICAAEAAQASDDPLHHAVIDLATGRAIGSLALMRVDTASGVMEVGFVCYSRQLKRTRAATEAQFLLMQRAFDELGYRRYEWKCDSLNAPSRAAAARLGSSSRGCSARPWSTRAAAATRPGSPSSTANGRRCARPTSAGWSGNFDAGGGQVLSLSSLVEQGAPQAQGTAGTA
jgi:hypothetical protein